MTTTSSRAEDLVPLRTEFDRIFRGYDRGQVRHYVRSTETELRLLSTDRDAAVTRAEELAGQLDELRTRNRELQAALDRVCHDPIDPAALPERLRRMVELAQDEAAEITARARAAAEESWSAATDAAIRLREHYERLVAELDARLRDMDGEHHELVRRARAEAEAVTRQARARQRELDEQAEHRRKEIEIDFEIAMAARRRDAMQAIVAQRTEAAAEAERVVREATEHARRIVTAARAEVGRLAGVRDELGQRLRAAEALLANATDALQPLPGEPVRPAAD